MAFSVNRHKAAGNALSIKRIDPGTGCWSSSNSSRLVPECVREGAIMNIELLLGHLYFAKSGTSGIIEQLKYPHQQAVP